MNEKRKITDLRHESLKKQPFVVPDGYFESFSERLREHIQSEGAAEPVRRFVLTPRFRVAIAAAVVGLALVSYVLIRFAAGDTGSPGTYPDFALLEQMQIMDDDTYLMELMDGSESLDEEEAFATQAIEYLAINDVEMVLLFE